MSSTCIFFFCIFFHSRENQIAPEGSNSSTRRATEGSSVNRIEIYFFHARNTFISILCTRSRTESSGMLVLLISIVFFCFFVWCLHDVIIKMIYLTQSKVYRGRFRDVHDFTVGSNDENETVQSLKMFFFI